MFDSIRPYELKQIQIDHSPKATDLFEECFIFKFFTDEQTKGGKTRYIARAEVYGECIAVKFYPQSTDEDHRYSISTNRFTTKGALRVIITCASLIPYMMELYPNASFVIKASEGIDLQTNMEEPESNNQRFRIYRNVLMSVIGNDSFQHYEYPNVSIYFLINRKDCNDLDEKRDRIKKEMIDRFNLVDL